MRKFTMTRRGTFTIKKSSSNQCKAPGHSKYRYVVKSECDDLLDHNGFVIDHVEVDKAVQRAVYSTSCELLCKSIVKVVYETISTHGARVRLINIEIEPAIKNPISKMEYKEVY